MKRDSMNHRWRSRGLVLAAVFGACFFDATAAQAIVGGTAVTSPDAAPGLTLIQGPATSGSTYCTATMVRPRWFVTAAHCFIGTRKASQAPRPDPTQWRARIGWISNASYHGEAVQADRIVLDQQYAGGAEHDLALLHVSRTVTTVPPGVAVSPVTLATAAQVKKITKNDKLWAIGYGVPYDENDLPLLRKVQLAGSLQVKGNVLHVDADPEHNVQPGDSGGPLVVQQNGAWIQLGALEGEQRNCRFCDTFDIYANLASPAIRGWLDTVVSTPEAPAGLVASSPAAGQVQLNWLPPPDSGDSPVSGYVVTWDDGTSDQTRTIPASPPTYTITGLQPGKTYTFSVAARNSAGVGNTAQVSATAGSTLSITTARLPDGFVGIDYVGGPTGSGGTLPWVWSATGLPDGLTMTSSGSIHGKPATTGTSQVTVTLVDGTGQRVTAMLPLTVNAEMPPPVTSDGTSLVYAPAPTCGTYCTTDWGDPHLRTLDGVAYDFQRVGEFTAVRSADNLEIQVRQQPWNGSRVVAVNSAVAARIGQHRVGIYLTDTGARVLLDGAPVTLGADPMQLTGGGTITLDAEHRRVVVSSVAGDYLAADYDPGSALNLTVGLPESQRGLVEGLLGKVGDDPTRWRVPAATSLFDYDAGQDTSTFTDLAFPYADLPLDRVPADNRDAARAVCVAAGVTDPALLDACTLDVALSGNRNAAAAAVVAQAAGRVLAASGAGQPWRDEAGATGVSELTYGHAGCTGIDANNVCTGGTWTTLPGAPWIWTHRLSSPGQYRATFTATVTVTAAQAEQPVRLWAAADDTVTASVNGEQVLTAGYNAPVSVLVRLKAGENTLAFDTANNPGDDQNGNPGGLAWKLEAES